MLVTRNVQKDPSFVVRQFERLTCNLFSRLNNPCWRGANLPIAAPQLRKTCRVFNSATILVPLAKATALDRIHVRNKRVQREPRRSPIFP